MTAIHPEDASPGRAVRILFALAGLTCAAGPLPVQAAVFHVDAALGSDTNDGLSWAGAQETVHAALASAAASPGPDEIHVARGRYLGVIAVPPDVVLLGGFPVGGGARDPKLNPTVLDGRGAGPVVSLGMGTDDSRIDGFRITGGRSNVPGEGGGVTLRMTSARVVQCVIEQCSAVEGGGLLVDARMHGHPMIERCIVRGNTASSAGGGIMVLTDDDAPLDMAIVHGSLVQGNSVRRPGGGIGVAGGGIHVRGRARIEHVHVRGNDPFGVVFDAPPGSAGALVNSEISGSPRDGLVVGCGATHVVVENCTLVDNAGAAIVGMDLRGGGGDWRAEVRRSIAWNDGVTGLPSGAGCTLIDAIVSDSVVQGGWPTGTNVIDRNPLLVKGRAMDYYLASRATGWPEDSVALDGGPEPAQDVGLSSYTTQTDSALDSGAADWGAHCVPNLGSIPVFRGQTRYEFYVIGEVNWLPFSDTPSVLHDPSLPLLFYLVDMSTDIHLRKNEALDTIVIIP
jgi:hypothetical protein